MVCLTFPLAHPNIFCVSPKHRAADPSSLAPALCQTSAAGPPLAQQLWGMQGTGHSTEQSCQPGGKRTPFCTAASLFWALTQHISEQDTNPGCPLCPRGCSQPAPCQVSAPAPKVLCKWRGMGLQRGTGLQPHSPYLQAPKSSPKTHQSSLTD